MTNRKRAISVYQVPNAITSTSQMEFLRRLQMSAENGHPRFVLDCSRIWDMDASMVRLLLCCLEEVMKHNGDVRLALLNPEAQAVLRLAGISRLFESFATTESAVQSFQLHAASMVPAPFDTGSFDLDTEYAA